MIEKKKTEIKYIQLNTTLLVAIICLIVGFIGGMIYSAYSSDTTTQMQPNFVSPGGSPKPRISPQQTEMILNLEKAISADPNNAPAWMELGNLYFDTENVQRAINAYQKYLELAPDNPNVWTDLGVMFRRNSQPNEAMAAFDKAVELDPRHEQSRYNKGVVLLHDLNDPIAAKSVWEELAKINPNFRAPGGRALKEILANL